MVLLGKFLYVFLLVMCAAVWESDARSAYEINGEMRVKRHTGKDDGAHHHHGDGTHPGHLHSTDTQAVAGENTETGTGQADVKCKTEGESRRRRDADLTNGERAVNSGQAETTNEEQEKTVDRRVVEGLVRSLQKTVNELIVRAETFLIKEELEDAKETLPSNDELFNMIRGALKGLQQWMTSSDVAREKVDTAGKMVSSTVSPGNSTEENSTTPTQGPQNISSTAEKIVDDAENSAKGMFKNILGTFTGMMEKALEESEKRVPGETKAEEKETDPVSAQNSDESPSPKEKTNPLDTAVSAVDLGTGVATDIFGNAFGSFTGLVDSLVSKVKGDKKDEEEGDGVIKVDSLSAESSDTKKTDPLDTAEKAVDSATGVARDLFGNAFGSFTGLVDSLVTNVKGDKKEEDEEDEEEGKESQEEKKKEPEEEDDEDDDDSVTITVEGVGAAIGSLFGKVTENLAGAVKQGASSVIGTVKNAEDSRDKREAESETLEGEKKKALKASLLLIMQSFLRNSQSLKEVDGRLVQVLGILNASCATTEDRNKRSNHEAEIPDTSVVLETYGAGESEDRKKQIQERLMKVFQTIPTDKRTMQSVHGRIEEISVFVNSGCPNEEDGNTERKKRGSESDASSEEKRATFQSQMVVMIGSFLRNSASLERAEERLAGVIETMEKNCKEETNGDGDDRKKRHSHTVPKSVLDGMSVLVDSYAAGESETKKEEIREKMILVVQAAFKNRVTLMSIDTKIDRMEDLAKLGCATMANDDSETVEKDA